MTEGLCIALRGIRDEIQPLTTAITDLEQKLAEARAELEPRRQLADWLEREIARRPAATGDTEEPEPVTGEAVAADEQLTIPTQSVEALRGPSRRQVAEQLLATVGRTRPVRARDVAEHYGRGVDHPQRENARSVLNRLVTLGQAVRLANGSFIPADLAPSYVQQISTQEAAVAQ